MRDEGPNPAARGGGSVLGQPRRSFGAANEEGACQRPVGAQASLYYVAILRVAESLGPFELR